MKSGDRRFESGASASGPGTDAARKVLACLNLAKKKYFLYPEGHAMCESALEALGRQLDLFLSSYGDLTLEVEQDALLYQEDAVLTETPGDTTLPFILFRDGIKTLKFTSGIAREELGQFLRIICRNCALADEPEGDVVTDFWEANLPHILYTVPDTNWQGERAESLELLSEMAVADPAPTGGKGKDDWDPHPEPRIDQASIELTMSDLSAIQDMVIEEERGDPTVHLDALLDSLLQHRNRENFETILDVLKDEFRKSLMRKDFGFSLRILEGLQIVFTDCVSDDLRTAPMMDDFFITISSPMYLDALQKVWGEIDPDQKDTLRELLGHLAPEALPSLCPVLLEPQTTAMRQMLMNSIVELASHDMTPLEALVVNQGEKLMEKLVHVVAALKSREADEMLKRMIRHASPYVRKEALKELCLRGAVRVEEVFGLVDDENASVRQMVLRLAGRSRNKAAEGLLLNYLENRKFRKSDGGHLIACFTALGRCGSLRSIPFLRKTLLGGFWRFGFARRVWYEGAAIALNAIRTPQALHAIEEASRSLIPGARRAARKYIRSGMGLVEVQEP
jgi:hypothetical protein